MEKKKVKFAKRDLIYHIINGIVNWCKWCDCGKAFTRRNLRIHILKIHGRTKVNSRVKVNRKDKWVKFTKRDLIYHIINGIVNWCIFDRLICKINNSC